MFVERASFD